ncbi:unnamed protein product [Didymodactylos carnosus]|uniref:Uncharacterized protein n=1 Tax=Didymodactylos carnosus TaxID=1234261 RepID=A0A814IDN9_9BILA|nr:unnamed protein product [Didymodactylos carnosus]CAF3793325.1 unnamed protein product [Didymodactylos carnosus]
MQCEIHSIYPYIDYRAEMKIMNSPYKPVLASIPVRDRVFIFWTNTIDELSAKACPRSGDVWSPNHFVPLVQPQQRFQTSPTQEISSILESPRKATTKNNQATFVRVPNFSPPPPAQRLINTISTLLPSSTEPQPALRSFDAERKRQERARENEQQKTRRLIDARLRTVSARQNEDESQRKKRLADDRQQKEATRAAESTEKTHERIRSISGRRRQRSLENKNRAKSDRLHWPRAIPTQQKDQCLQDFVNQTSTSVLKQAVCAVCNLRTFISSMDEYDMNQIPNQARLAGHPDLPGVIPGTGSVPPVDEANIDKLPENDVPECIWSTMEILNDVADAEAERAGFVSDPLAAVAERSEHSGTENIPMNARIRTDAASRTTSMEASEEVTEQEEFVYMIPRSIQPVNDFSNPELLPGLYPTLFPYGCGVPEDSFKTDKNITESTYPLHASIGRSTFRETSFVHVCSLQHDPTAASVFECFINGITALFSGYCSESADHH